MIFGDLIDAWKCESLTKDSAGWTRLTTQLMLRKLSILRLMSSALQTRTRCCSGVLCNNMSKLKLTMLPCALKGKVSARWRHEDPDSSASDVL